MFLGRVAQLRGVRRHKTLLVKPEIENAETLVSIFGRWPSFHDAEVWSLTQERTPKGFDVIATIHVFEMTSEVDARGFFRLQKHTRVVFRFVDCRETRFQWFNHQNVLSELQIEPADKSGVRTTRVVFGSSYGLEGELFCDRVLVVEAVPWVPPFGVYAATAQAKL